MKVLSILKSALFLLCFSALFAACFLTPPSAPADAGRPDSGLQVTPDSGVRPDAGLLPGDACALLNARRCGFLARCGLIDDEAQAREECERSFEATWCGPLTWPSHVAKGALKYEASRAEACAEAFSTQACGEWKELPDSCTRFLVPRVPLGGECYEGFAECTDGVCRGSSCPRTCQPRALLDDPCSSDGDCRSGLYCKLSPFTSNAGQCSAYGTNGTPCEESKQCLEGLQCLNQMCRVLPLPGSPCVEGQCSETGFCEGALSDAGVCAARKQEGAACVEGQCQSSLVCDPVRAACVKSVLSSGDICSLSQRCPTGEVCLGADVQTVGLCRAPLGEGESCVTHLDCEAHLACQEGDGGHSCQRRATSGSSCRSEENCQSGAFCASAICTALPLPGQSCAETRACRWGLCRELANTDGGAVCGAFLSPGTPCNSPEECASGSCVEGTCLARCVP